jgi:DNA-directed RNA polymerase
MLEYNIDKDYLDETEEMQDLILEQVFMENTFLEEATKKYNNNITNMLQAGLFANTTEGSILQKMAIEAVSEQIKGYFTTNTRGNGAMYRDFLRDNFSGREDVLAFTIVEFMLNAVSSSTPKLTNLTNRITSKVLDLLSVEQFQENEPKFYAYLEYEYKSRGIGYINSRKKKLAKMTGNNINEGTETIFKTMIGARLIDCVMTSGCNLFEVRFQYKGRKTEKVLVLTEDAQQIIGRIKDRNVLFSVTYKPLIAPPIDWVSLWGNGGYYTSNNQTFIRNQKACKYIEQNVPDGQLDRMYDVINHIQNTKWKINEYTLGVVNSLIDNSMIDPTSPKSNPKFYGGLPYMDTLNVYDMIPKGDYGELDDNGRHKTKEGYKNWYRAKEIQLKKLEANRSKRIMFTLAHNIATEYVDRDFMYFTYNTDFRGRLYPIQQILNPQSTGAVKSFLTFADAKALSKTGLYWLKVHTANNWGIDKLSYDERVSWVDDNIKDIYDYAKNPMDTVEYWNEADEPLMFLSACKALLDHSEGIPVSLPVSLDATCSGLQLYSGLLMDKEGAEAVNVINRYEDGKVVRADVYTDIAEVCNQALHDGNHPTKITFTTMDGENKLVTTRKEVKDLKDKINRALVKRPIMTIPYSVTKRGMFEQIRDLLNEMEDDEKVFWKGDKWVIAKILVELISEAVNTHITGASVGQAFIKEVIHDYYSTGSDAPLIWETPHFKFPVVQWKTKSKEHRVRSVFGRLTVQIPTSKINKQQQGNGIAPNLIHSLDATLMYLTVEKLRAQGVSNYMLIHDSFGVPPNDVHKLNTAVRESFVELFEGNPLDDWINQVSPEHSKEAEDIMLNTLDINKVLDSTYIFS